MVGSIIRPGGERVKSYTEEMRGKNEGSLTCFFFPHQFFDCVLLSEHLEQTISKTKGVLLYLLLDTNLSVNYMWGN